MRLKPSVNTTSKGPARCGPAEACRFSRNEYRQPLAAPADPRCPPRSPTSPPNPASLQRRASAPLSLSPDKRSRGGEGSADAPPDTPTTPAPASQSLPSRRPLPPPRISRRPPGRVAISWGARCERLAATEGEGKGRGGEGRGEKGAGEVTGETDEGRTPRPEAQRPTAAAGPAPSSPGPAAPRPPLTVPDIGDEDGQASHPIALRHRRHRGARSGPPSDTPNHRNYRRRHRPLSPRGSSGRCSRRLCSTHAPGWLPRPRGRRPARLWRPLPSGGSAAAALFSTAPRPRRPRSSSRPPGRNAPSCPGALRVSAGGHNQAEQRSPTHTSSRDGKHFKVKLL